MTGVRKAFNQLVGNLEYSMFVVTARVGDERVGCLIGFATQASIDPPRFLVCLSHKNHTFRVGGDSEHFGVHAVPADGEEIAELFGGETGDDVDKFARCEWHDGPEGVPILEACEKWFVGRVVSRTDAGDHDAYLLAPIAAHAAKDGAFTFHRAKRISPGHAP